MRNQKIRKSISLDPDLVKKTEQAALNDNRSFSNLISILLKEYLSKKK